MYRRLRFHSNGDIAGIMTTLGIECLNYHRNPIFLTRININPGMDKWLHPLKLSGEINYPFPNFNDGTVEVWEWISNFIPHFTGHVITYPCWD